MNIPQIQSQLCQNRACLYGLHAFLATAIILRKQYSGDEDYHHYTDKWHKNVVKTRKLIARMVVLQKALKFDLSCIIEKQRRSREIIKQNEVRITAMIQAGECT